MNAGLAVLAPHALHAYWVLATFAALVAALPIKGMQGFRHAVQLSAARGKLWEDRPIVNLGPLTNAAVPQSWFSHFYALGSACNLAVSALLVSQLASQPAVQPHQEASKSRAWSLSFICHERQAASLIALAALQCHLLRRWYESIFVMVYPPAARMHAIAYLFGLSYYGVLGLSLLPSADLVELVQRDGAAHGSGLLQFWDQRTKLLQTASGGMGAWTLLGLAVFFGGNALQNQSHRILAALAPAAGNAARRQEAYSIPRGGAFEWVSCPHYLGEIVIYLGLLLVLHGRQLNAWLILLWVVCNLVLAARATHQWYQCKFDSYPRRRHALVPWTL